MEKDNNEWFIAEPSLLLLDTASPGTQGGTDTTLTDGVLFGNGTF